MEFRRPNTLPKEERLYCRKDIAELLAEGRFTGGFPIRMCARTGTGAGFCRLMVSVPKKLFKRAVKRNLLKRRLREAYRLQKGLLDGVEADILLVYGSRELLSSAEIHARVGELLTGLARRCAKESKPEEKL